MDGSSPGVGLVIGTLIGYVGVVRGRRRHVGEDRMVKLGWWSDGTGYSEVACVPVQMTEDQRKTAIK